MNLPDDYHITTDDDDDDCQMDHFSSLDQYMNGCLKMNFTFKSKIHRSDCKESISPDINIQYLHLIDGLCKLMESCDPAVFIDKCASLMASDNHNIALFSYVLLKDFREYDNVSVILRYLMCYFTWYDLSVVQKLLEICDYPDCLKLLEEFKQQIEVTKPITEYPICNPNPLMIPSDTSPFTVMATQCEANYSPLSFKHVEAVKSLITKTCEITSISCQFLTNDLQVFYWLIPKTIVPLMASKVQHNCSHLQKSGIMELSIYPTSVFFTGGNKSLSLFAIFYTDSNNAETVRYTVYRELFVKENFRDMLIVTVFVRKHSQM